MSIDPCILRAMQAAGASIDVIIAAVEAAAAKEEERKEKKRENNAERQRRFKAKRKTTGNADNALPPVTAPLDDIYSNPPVFDVSNETSAVSDLATRVVGDWNQKIAGTPLPTARKLSPDRLKHLRARVRQHGEEAVFTAIRNMTASDFHSGRTGKWLEGCLGWLLKNNENFEKMLDRTNSQPPPATPSNLSLLIDQAKRYPKDQAA